MGKFRIGVVGCGNISTTYLRNAPLFRNLEIRACADLSADMARKRAEEFGIRAMTVNALMAAALSPRAMSSLLWPRPTNT